jgi:hypothetical protein
MLFCFTDTSAEILLHVSGSVFCLKHHSLAHFSRMLLPLKGSKITCAKGAHFGTKNVVKIRHIKSSLAIGEDRVRVN